MTYCWISFTDSSQQMSKLLMKQYVRDDTSTTEWLTKSLIIDPQQ